MEVNKTYNCDALEGLKKLSNDSINCCITSPPYYGLRDYGKDGQIGLEETPDKYIEKLVDVFGEVKRVLKDDGTLWVNIGDSYAGSGKGVWDKKGKQKETYIPDSSSPQSKMNKIWDGIKSKDLIGIPWMLAFALRNDGWYLRQDIIWQKPNAMPESVRDRCTKSHEYIFLLSKSKKYYFDYEAIKEPCINGDPCSPRGSVGTNTLNSGRRGSGNKNTEQCTLDAREFRNKRSVWTITTKPLKEAHFATFPIDLIEPCVLAGCPENGLVLDVFMGSGTTGRAAKNNNRNYIGFDLNEEYCRIANKRINV